MKEKGIGIISEHMNQNPDSWKLKEIQEQKNRKTYYIVNSLSQNNDKVIMQTEKKKDLVKLNSSVYSLWSKNSSHGKESDEMIGYISPKEAKDIMTMSQEESQKLIARGKERADSWKSHFDWDYGHSWDTRKAENTPNKRDVITMEIEQRDRPEQDGKVYTLTVSRKDPTKEYDAGHVLYTRRDITPTEAMDIGKRMMKEMEKGNTIENAIRKESILQNKERSGYQEINYRFINMTVPKEYGRNGRDKDAKTLKEDIAYENNGFSLSKSLKNIERNVVGKNSKIAAITETLGRYATMQIDKATDLMFMEKQGNKNISAYLPDRTLIMQEIREEIIHKRSRNEEMRLNPETIVKNIERNGRQVNLAETKKILLTLKRFAGKELNVDLSNRRGIHRNQQSKGRNGMGI